MSSDEKGESISKDKKIFRSLVIDQFKNGNGEDPEVKRRQQNKMLPYFSFWNTFGPIIYSEYKRYCRDIELEDIDLVPFIHVKFSKRKLTQYEKNHQHMMAKRTIEFENRRLHPMNTPIIIDKMTEKVKTKVKTSKGVKSDSTRWTPNNIKGEELLGESKTITSKEIILVETIHEETVKEDSFEIDCQPVIFNMSRDDGLENKSTNTDKLMIDSECQTTTLPEENKGLMSVKEKHEYELKLFRVQRKVGLRESEVKDLRRLVMSKINLINELRREISEMRSESPDITNLTGKMFEEICMREYKSYHNLQVDHYKRILDQIEILDEVSSEKFKSWLKDLSTMKKETQSKYLTMRDLYGAPDVGGYDSDNIDFDDEFFDNFA